MLTVRTETRSIITCETRVITSFDCLKCGAEIVYNGSYHSYLCHICRTEVPDVESMKASANARMSFHVKGMV